MKKLLFTIIGFITAFVCNAVPQQESVNKEIIAGYKSSTLDKNSLEECIKETIIASDSERDVLIKDILTEAKSHLGKRYVWATRGPKTFDCSGFVYYVFKQFGYNFSPSSRNQYTLGVKVDRNEVREGDLIFFTSRRSGKKVGHVGIVYYVDNEKLLFIHASVRGVKISELEGYYKQRFVGYKRVID